MGLHTCEPPTEALAQWLAVSPGGTNDNPGFGHLLLEQHAAPTEGVLDAIRNYFRSAHSDAREHFHAFAGISLHPDGGDGAPAVSYPECLPSTARRGLFGEVMAGLVAEAYELVGGHEWAIPVFLFRFHADVEAYLFNLARDPAQHRQVWGRFGSDAIAVRFDGDGKVVRVLVGEAKWRNILTESVVQTLLLGELIDNPNGDGTRVRSGLGIYNDLNRSLLVPYSLRQLQQLLRELAPEEYEQAILSLDQILLADAPAPVDRTDLVLISGNQRPARPPGETLIPPNVRPLEYTAPRDLQVVELILENGGQLIDTLYESLWPVEAQDAAAGH